MKKRVVVTGIGVIAPCGIGKEQYWNGLEEGKSRIQEDPDMVRWQTKSTVSSRIPDFDIKEFCKGEGWDTVLSCDRFVHLGIASGIMALEDSVPFPSDEAIKGMVFSSAIGGTPFIEEIFKAASNEGKTDIRHISTGPSFYNSGMFNFPATELARKFHLQGPVVSLSTGCTAGMDALGLGSMLIQSGEATVMLAASSEAPLCPLTYATLDVIHSLSTAKTNPSAASRPFDKHRAGFVIAEGSACLILEEREYALKRGAKIYAEVLSYASMNNAWHMNELPHHGEPMVEVIKQAMKSAQITPSQINYINAHGSSTQQNDLFETNAYKHVLGECAYRIPISSTKSLIGHSLSSASLLGSIAAIGAILRSKIHPTANYEHVDELCDLYYVPNRAIDKDVNISMVTASGFGGIHSAAIFAKDGYNE